MFDNLSSVGQDFSDVSCKILDGTGISRRTLYTTADETVIELGRPLVFTSINEHLVRSPDLIDRVIVEHSSRIDDAARLDEDEVIRRAEALRPQLLGLLLKAAAKALGRWEDQDLCRRPRRIGVAKWIEAAHDILGLEAGEFTDAYCLNQEQALKASALANVVIAAVLDFVEQRAGWSGLTSELYREVTALQRGRGPLSDLWPKSARIFGEAVARAKHALTLLGWSIEQHHTNQGTRISMRRKSSSAGPWTKTGQINVTDVTDITGPEVVAAEPEESDSGDGGDIDPATFGPRRGKRKCRKASDGKVEQSATAQGAPPTAETPSPEPPIKGANGDTKPELLP